MIEEVDLFVIDNDNYKAPKKKDFSTDYKYYLTDKEYDRISYLDIERIRQANWADRHRFEENITNQEIALYLLVTNQHANETKIKNLKETQQKQIQKLILKYLKQFNAHQEIVMIKEMLSSKKFLTFKKEFRTTYCELVPISDRDNFNTYINYESSTKVDVPLEELQELKYISFVLFKLEKHGIDPQSYDGKVSKYIGYIRKLSEEFGILISNDIPFSSPEALYITMDAKLSKLGFNNKQKTKFYRDFNIRKSSPDKKKTLEKLHNDMIRDLGYKFRTLSKEEQNAAEYLHTKKDASELSLMFVLGNDKSYDETILMYENHEFSAEYYNILKEYGLEEFPIESIDMYFEINTEFSLTDSPWQIDGAKETTLTAKKLDQKKYALIRSEQKYLKYDELKKSEEERWKEFEADILELADDSHLLHP